jgi:iron complex transport system ATP-binding protein
MEPASNNQILLQTEKLEVGYNNSGHTIISLLKNLSLHVNSGELITLIGPNGCGKSTLIKTLVGLIPELSGQIKIAGKTEKQLGSAEKSQLLGVVLTEPVYEKNMTAYDIVSLGRYQYTNWFGRLEEYDKNKVNKALAQVGLEHKKYSRLNELSDGERQRAMIAKVLAQDVDLIILDEPTAHLDLPNRMEMLLLLRQISHESGKGILLSTHELGLALQVSDIVWLIERNQELCQSLPEDLILSGKLDKTFGNNHIGFQPFSASFELIPNKPYKACVVGDGLLTACVIRMLKRIRIPLVQDPDSLTMKIEVNEQKKEMHVLYKKKMIFLTMSELQNYLTSLINDSEKRI